MKPLFAFALGTVFGVSALWLSLPRLQAVDLVGYANRVLLLSADSSDRRTPRPAAEREPGMAPAPGSGSSAQSNDPLTSSGRGAEPLPPESLPPEPLAQVVPSMTAPGPDRSEPLARDEALETLPAAPPPAVVLTPSQLLGMPIAGLKASQLRDDFDDPRGEGRGHEAIDIAAATGTPVLAVDDGRVVKLFTSERGGLTVYQFDAKDEVAYYYAHLDHYAAGLAEGQQIKRGDLIGYVGYTGNANVLAPHLHFAIFVLGPEKQWWKGTPVNPYPRLGGR